MSQESSEDYTSRAVSRFRNSCAFNYFWLRILHCHHFLHLLRILLIHQLHLLLEPLICLSCLSIPPLIGFLPRSSVLPGNLGILSLNLR